MNTYERIRQFLKVMGMTTHFFEKKVGLSNGYITNVKNPTQKVIEKIAVTFPELNFHWLITGEGDMLKPINTQTIGNITHSTVSDIVAGDKVNYGGSVASNNSQSNTLPFSVSEFQHRGYGAYYSDIPVSAGRYDLATVINNKEPESWIKIPGITASLWFPVIGCSMEPKIHAGDVVGVVPMDNWEMLDPDKIYLIVTHEDRMIKHLETDETNADIIWAVSENYKKFKIQVEDIKIIYRVVWAGRLV
jgi:hypothetical protein